MTQKSYTIFKILLLTGSILGASAMSLYAQDADPLAQFRKSQSVQNAPAQQSPNAPQNGDVLPSPTLGGMQQQGLSQEQINQTLQNYDFGDGLTMEERREAAEQMARDSAFQAMMNGTFPLKPEEILEFLDRFRDVREAQETRIGGVPDSNITMESVSLDPGATPPTIKLSPGYVTTMNIVDVTGQPWPVKDVSWGGNFEIIQPETGSHVVRISPMKSHEVGNLSIQLLDLDTPVIFSLQTQLETVDVRYDAQIPEYGPNADTPIIENTAITATAGNKDILKILDGVPPAGTTKLDVDGVDGRTSAYTVGEQTYVRTPHSLLSPGWSGSIKSADGTTVYAIGRSPVLLLSDKGKMIRAMIDYK